MDGFDRLRRHLAAVRIVHHVRGRIRLRLDASPDLPASPDLSRFRVMLGRIEGVRALRLNLLARSCIVEYDPGVIPEAAWDDFLAGAESEAAAALEAILRRKYRELAA